MLGSNEAKLLMRYDGRHKKAENMDKFEINRFKAPACFLAMALAAMLLLGIAGTDGMQEAEGSDNYPQEVIEAVYS